MMDDGAGSQGGYEVYVMAGKRLLAHVELSMDEQLAVEAVARRGELINLAAFPDYWGPEYRVRVDRLAALLEELAQVADSSPQAEARSAVRKLRRVVTIAISNGLPVDVVPD